MGKKADAKATAAAAAAAKKAADAEQAARRSVEAVAAAEAAAAAAVAAEEVRMEEERNLPPFPPFVPRDGELFDVLKVQISVYKKHLHTTIKTHDLSAFETLRVEFDELLYGPFVENKPFVITKRHGKAWHPIDEADKGELQEEGIELGSEDHGSDEQNALVQAYLRPCTIAADIVHHPIFGHIMISAIVLAGLLVGAQTYFDCGVDANDKPWLTCRADILGRDNPVRDGVITPQYRAHMDQNPCGGGHYNMSKSECGAVKCCWLPAVKAGGRGTCYGRSPMPECTDSPTVLAIMHGLDLMVLAMFTVECVLKIMSERLRPWKFFVSPTDGDAAWNSFDFLIVLACYMPGGDKIAVLRLARLTRVLKLLDKIVQLKIIMEGLMDGMSAVSYILIMLTLMYYVFSIICMMMFRLNDPVHFGELHISMLTLFRMSTMEDWTDVMYINMYGCNKYGYKPAGAMCYGFVGMPENRRYYGDQLEDVNKDYCSGDPKSEFTRTCPPIPAEYAGDPDSWPGKNWYGIWTAIFFSVFIVLTGLVVMSLFIGVITSAMQIASDKAIRERKEGLQAEARQTMKDRVAAERFKHLAAHAANADGGVHTFDLQNAVKAEMKLSGLEDPIKKTSFMDLSKIADRIVKNTLFQNAITACIVLAGLLIGLQTYPAIDEAFYYGFLLLDNIILVVFIVELILKIIACGFHPTHFFYVPKGRFHLHTQLEEQNMEDVQFDDEDMDDIGVQGWNTFDFVVVVACIMPESWTGEGVAALRLLRLLRVLKLFNKLTQLQIILSGLAQGMNGVVWIALLMMILFYVFACAAIGFYRVNDPVHFGDLSASFVSLFRAATMEDWTDIMYIQMYGCKQYTHGDLHWTNFCENSIESGMSAAIFFVIFILLSSLVMMNLVVGVVCQSMQEASDNHNAHFEKRAAIEGLSRNTGIELSIVQQWEKGFYEIDDSEGYAPGNVHRDDLDDLLCSLKEEDLLTEKGREHLNLSAYHSMPSGQIGLVEFLTTLAQDLANLRAAGEDHKLRKGQTWVSGEDGQEQSRSVGSEARNSDARKFRKAGGYVLEDEAENLTENPLAGQPLSPQ